MLFRIEIRVAKSIFTGPEGSVIRPGNTARPSTSVA
jgi:hypothetical protein